MPLQLTWKLSRSAKALDIEYRVLNQTDKPIHVLDQIVTTTAKGLVVEPDRVIVRFDPDANTLVLRAGYLAPMEAVRKGAGVGVEDETMPVARALAPNAAITGTKHVPLPLAPWHPDLGSSASQVMAPIPASPANVVFEVSYLPDDQIAWQERPAADGQKLHMPSPQSFAIKKQTLRGDTQKLP
jgi:hypothetical protein